MGAGGSNDPYVYMKKLLIMTVVGFVAYGLVVVFYVL
jgi:hypothetical protein